jgi:hypothetical protein
MLPEKFQYPIVERGKIDTFRTNMNTELQEKTRETKHTYTNRTKQQRSEKKNWQNKNMSDYKSSKL